MWYISGLVLSLADASVGSQCNEQCSKAADRYPSEQRLASLVLALQALLDGSWSEIEAAELVPGDIVSVRLGDIIPADCRLMEGDPLKIDQVSHPARQKSHPVLSQSAAGTGQWDS